jgi:hypothetical protein
MWRFEANTKRCDWRILLAVLLLVLFSPVARVDADEVRDLKLGFSQNYTLGHWVPIKFTFAPDASFSGSLELLVPDSDGIQARYVVPQSSLTVAGDLIHVSHYVRVGRVHSNIIVRAIDGGTARDISVPSPSVAFAGTDRMVVSVGADLGLEEVAQEYVRGTASFTKYVHLEDGEDLPNEWWGYDGIDTLVLTTDGDHIAAITPTQIAAILKWVEQGGNLILSVGRGGEELLAEGKPFAGFAPGRFVRVMNQRKTEQLEGAVTATQSLQAEVALSPIRQSLISDPDGRLHIHEIGAGHSIEPIVVEQARGFGRLIFVAVDLNQPPLSSWNDREKLLGKLLTLTLPAEEESQRTGSVGKVLHEGYDDLSGQLRNSLDQYEGVGLIAFSWIVGISLIYLLLVGPGDFLLVNQVLKRPRLTWITLPIFIALFCGVAYWLDGTYKSKEPQLNQIDLVDIDDRSRTVRGTSWHSLYSPFTQSFQLRLSPTSELTSIAKPGDQLLTWQGLPGKGLGGMQAQANTVLVSADYSIATNQSENGVVTQIDGLPIAISSSRALFTQWTGVRKTEEFGVLGLDKNGRLSGDLKNPLPFALKQAVLYHQNRIYRLPESWKTNRVIDVRSLRNSARDLESFLTGRAVRFNDKENTRSQWDPTSGDVERIMQMVMFYRAAGGLGYTGLSNRYHPQLDTSSMLRNNRAVIVGAVEQPATELFDGEQSLSDRTKSWTIYRIVVPIDETPAQ